MDRSLSARRAWIEIAVLNLIPLSDPSLSARRAWIEISSARFARSVCVRSLSARRAWIEICRNWRKQSNHHVALRKESVDRNSASWIGKKIENASLSARRAWIEIWRMMPIP